tara:strand:+ start:416 stop:721 length:306 start_codon:yes stop_codon:yes gene_type:complete
VNKYRAIRTEVDGIMFASKKEAMRYKELKFLLQEQRISDLVLQPKFPIEVCGKKICTYIADFIYNENGIQVIEDVKGVKTSVYRIKKKLTEAIYNITIKEV